MENIKVAMEKHLDNLTKPRGSLGKLEGYCIKLADIQGKVPPEIKNKGIYVFAGDHGIAAEGVSLYPQEVTRQMVLNILRGGAGINALATGTNWEINLVDAGVLGDEFPPDSELKPLCNFIRARETKGSRNFYKESALTKEELQKSLEQGKRLARDAAAKNYGLTAIGDLGIGNTSTAAAMLVAAGFDPNDMVDRGTGIDAPMLDHKKHIIIDSVKRRNPAKTGESILENLGSSDLAMMTGFILGLENLKIGCVLDGFPVTSAAYIAWMINPKVSNWLFAGHLSKVAGHKPALERMGLEPIVSLDMRLGEGTGAVIGGHIIELGVLAARNMASFSEAHITDSEKQEEKY
ncbi:nicotinate-nucleotide--dimethylbenzimidazole phosphoribosyltransferase [Leadbettera azotonutricia]|uniref:Nicotinate-nucleotide--dimethylbenzimidazole phosphoribosyltransferase n=1 Tax=Leadbettera azotonutricia (strain ATCC BAA-888 / DSM 13862 / ZAS-9) TaxID=545695 RepID=F5Y842_LEAAZ|nr:nicotinate-nucleotide--dimethylbenzimidazole phosphoribosyltransferase [Leadbettera azotonutricia]AEF83344.1 nicotinate-nucleotide--dimethylbenzimidazole phosphoribosyltransferase [Leadbettera azotonutricia ZAS-9]